MLSDIISKAKEIDSISQKSKLPLSTLTLVLLFGTSSSLNSELINIHKKFAQNENALVFIKAADVNTDEVVSEISTLLSSEQVHNSGAGNLKNILVCPIVSASKENIQHLISVADALDDYGNKHHIDFLWTPFLKDVVQSENDIWINDIEEKLLKKGRKTICGIISKRNSIGITLNDKNIALNIMMSILFFANEVNDVELRTYINSGKNENDCFYTVSAVSINLPIHIYVLSTLKNAIERATTDTLKKSKQGNLNLDLHSIFEKYEFCGKGKKIPLEALFGVMSSNEGGHQAIDELKENLDKFADKYFFSNLSEDKKEILEKIHEEFLKEFKKGEKSLDYLNQIERNWQGNINLPNGNIMETNELPDFKKSSKFNMPENILQIYKDTANNITVKANNYDKNLLDEYFNSQQFLTIKKYFEMGQSLLTDLISEFENELSMEVEMLQVLNNSDLIRDSTIIKSQSTIDKFDEYVRNIFNSSLKSDEEETKKALSLLTSEGYLISRDSALKENISQKYIKTLNEKCQNPDDGLTKSFISRVEREIAFPIHTDISNRLVFFWGGIGSNFFEAWRKSNIDFRQLQINPNDHITMLAVSKAFSKDVLVQRSDY